MLTLGGELVEKGRDQGTLSIVQSGWNLIGAFVSLGELLDTCYLTAITKVPNLNF